MGISIYAVLIIITSLFAKVEDFEGYIHKSERYGSTPNYIYAIGQYEEDLMNGVWEFYTDSTKKVKIAKGEFINGNGSKISKTGIPINGRHGEWKHYYSYKNYRNSNRLSNPIRSIQNWKNGKMNGNVSIYYKNGKKSASSYYRNGKRNGIRKEWFQGGFQGTKLARISKFSDGNLLNDNLFTFGSRKILSTNYINGNKVDSFFQSIKGYDSKIFIVHMKNRMKMFHNNGQIYNDVIVNNDNSLTIKSYYDNGQLINEVYFDSLGYRYWKNNLRICYDPDGKIIDKIKFKDNKIHGNVVELATANMKINSNFHKILNPYVQYNFNPKSNRYEHTNFSRGKIYYRNSIRKNDVLKYLNNTKNFINYHGRNNILGSRISSLYIPDGVIPFNLVRSRNNDYYIDKRGIKIETLDTSKFNNYNYCIGYGSYNNGIRVGRWHWEDKTGNTILEGIFNDEGNPVGQWDSYGIDEVFTFSENGELIKTMKTIIKD